MFEKLKFSALAAATAVTLAVASPAAQAATWTIVDGGSYTVTESGVYSGTMDLWLAGAPGALTGPGQISANFTVLTSGSGVGELALTNYGAGLFTGLTASWLDTATNAVLASVGLGAGNNSLSTTFGGGSPLTQTLLLSWDSLLVPTTAAQSQLNPDVTFEVAPIPLPATGLLLLGAVGATAMLRRRKGEKAA
ncbi:MAG: VPLPA-CTERM sorting domain-containing protein [Paracoccus sp. (in: a-proteobacteria)]|uniref:VPLPA-CTERM sorting domain-containing protein n=1 Tax=Paracoccus sp. TaxID=267 RepID=UPI0026E04182|nr:VPLPA-CTERM sorting domain-containing protein [Paracoccus sp. (in: a-proteobacteria)]MDO5632509.1 VPLPA-CTERM sorting domain-containing protein [Paracoccus sp. (in: a-proteobacteria)]